jgi:uncharacterized membrane protein
MTTRRETRRTYGLGYQRLKLKFDGHPQLTIIVHGLGTYRRADSGNNAMRIQWLKAKEWVRTSYWVVPSLMGLSAAGLAVFAIWADRGGVLGELREVFWLYGGSVDGARVLLSTLAASMITVIGVVFSVTIVVLSLASQQFGPRLLRNFISDLGNQVSLGTFIGNFVFDLLVLSQVSEYSDADNFVPRISVTLGLAFSVLSAGVLIYFINHMASTVQVETILDRVYQELEQSIERLFPEHMGADVADVPEEAAKGQALPVGFEEDAEAARAPASGYVQAVDTNALLRSSQKADAVVRLDVKPGDFVVEGAALAWLWPASKATVSHLREVASAVTIGSMRTPTQDAEFCINQLVQVACRALSPGINDPFTAIVCVDRLSAAICTVLGRRLPSDRRYDDSGSLRVVTHATSFAGLMDAAFHQIRQAASGNVAVSIRLLEAFARMKPHVRRREDGHEIMRHAHLVEDAVGSSPAQRQDLKDVDERANHVAQEPETAPPPGKGKE